ncbi:MAG: hypothetical protein ABIM99_05960 [Candidatus Dojkabacteria bacterium]
MEASTQPHLAAPTPASQIPPISNLPLLEPTNATEGKKRNMPLIISLVLFFFIIAVLVILLLIQSNSSNNFVNNTVVSQPVTETTTTPETSGANSDSTVTQTNTDENTFESRLFYLGFDYPKPLDQDETTRITYPDGTTWCFSESAQSFSDFSNINLGIQKGTGDCESIGPLPSGESFTLTSKDNKVFNFVILDDVSAGFYAVGEYISPAPSDYRIRISIGENSLDKSKLQAQKVISSLIFDTTRMRTELTDKILTSSNVQP